MNWNIVAEVLGLLSGCALLWPAIAQNASLRNAAIMIKRLNNSRSKIGPMLAKTSTAQHVNQLSWLPRDQWLLTIGTALLLLSFGLKLVLLLA